MKTLWPLLHRLNLVFTLLSFELYHKILFEFLFYFYDISVFVIFICVIIARRTYFHVFEDTAERFEAIDRSGTWNWTLGLPANTVEADGSELTEYVPPEPHPPDLVEQMLRIVVLPEADLFDPKVYCVTLLSHFI
jgi:hypothetical protein